MRYTVNNEKISKVLSITRGVPFLLLVYINGYLTLATLISCCMLMMRFCCVTSNKTSRGLKHKSETELHKIENWVVANKLKFNSDKTNYIIFRTRQKPK